MPNISSILQALMQAQQPQQQGPNNADLLQAMMPGRPTTDPARSNSKGIWQNRMPEYDLEDPENPIRHPHIDPMDGNLQAFLQGPRSQPTWTEPQVEAMEAMGKITPEQFNEMMIEAIKKRLHERGEQL